MSDPIQTPPERMTLAQFHSWVEQQPRGRFELIAGDVVAMAPERSEHIDSKSLAWLALRNAVRSAGIPCHVYADGFEVRVGDDTAYLPDAVVNCGDRLPRGSLFAPNPVIVVEVASPSTARFDAVTKFSDYMRLPSIRHYLIVDAVKQLVIHHRKRDDGTILSAILGAGPLTLDPPGITIAVEDLFEA